MITAGKDRLKATQTFLCCSLQGRMPGWIVSDGLNLFDHSGESGSYQVMKFAGILHVLVSDPYLFWQFAARDKTSRQFK
jgi:hypothetical protein